MATAASVPKLTLVDRFEYFSDWFRAKKSVALSLYWLHTETETSSGRKKQIFVWKTRLEVK